MGSSYSKPIGGITTQLTPNLTIHSAPFIRQGVTFGARTTFIKLNGGSLVIFSPMPFGNEMQGALDIITDSKKEEEKVKYLVAPDFEHYMGIKSWKDKFPKAQILTIKELNEKLPKNSNCEINHCLTPEMGNKVLKTTDLSKIGIEEDFINEIEIVYFPTHVNKEIVLFHKPTNTLIEADLMLNMPPTSQHPDGVSFVTKHMKAGSGVSNFLTKKVMGDKRTASDGIGSVLGWDFDRIIPCHGEVIERGAKQVFEANFKEYIN